jgi:hypothetical protein
MRLIVRPVVVLACSGTENVRTASPVTAVVSAGYIATAGDDALKVTI